MYKVSNVNHEIGSSILLGVAQIFLWGGSFFILAVLATPIQKDTGWPQYIVYGVLSLSLLISGLISPYVGKKINSTGNSLIIKLSGIIMGIGLLVVGFAYNPFIYFSGWSIIGLGMGMGLYDSLFATLGKRLESKANRAIVQITLVSGFAPTLSWPLVSTLTMHYEWRGACIIYGIILIVLIFPLHYYAFRMRDKQREQDIISFSCLQETVYEKQINNNNNVFMYLLLYFTIGAIILTVISVNLIAILIASDVSISAAVSVAALLGPSQVGVRILDIILPKRTPVVNSVFSAIAILAGLLLFYISPYAALLGVIVYGLGNGMRSILKGTLPLYIYGRTNYATVIGKLAQLPLIVQAVTPFACGYIVQQAGAFYLLLIICLLAFANVIIAAKLQGQLKNKFEL